MNSSQAAHLPQLTWLRGIAALLVLFSHINRANEASYSGELKQEFLLLNWLDLGSFGVALFFTLSGCTLYLSASTQGFPNLKSWGEFYVKRFFRIWPTFAVSISVYLLAGIAFHDILLPYRNEWLGSQFVSSYTTNDIINYLLLIFNFTGPAGLFNNAFWSLPVEFQYYLALPILVVLLQKLGPLALLVTVIIGHLLYKADFNQIDSTLVFRLFFTFALGILAGHIYKKCLFRIKSRFTTPILFALFIFTYHFSNGSFSEFSMPSEWIVYGLVAVSSVTLIVLTNLSLPRKLDSALTFYGNISYSLYLFHNLAIAVAVVLLIKYPVYLTPHKLLFLTISTVSLGTFIAWLSYSCIELPSIKVGKHLSKISRARA